jgi:hypothetical protein
MKRIQETISDFKAIVFATLREIFDEASYARFLSRAGMASSSAAYAAFCREREKTSAHRPRCC